MTVPLMGGDMQAQGHAQVLVNILDLGANLQAAADMARFRHAQVPNVLSLESALFTIVGANSPRWATGSARSTVPTWAAFRPSWSIRRVARTAAARISARTARQWVGEGVGIPQISTREVPREGQVFGPGLVSGRNDEGHVIGVRSAIRHVIGVRSAICHVTPEQYRQDNARLACEALGASDVTNAHVL